MYLEVCFWWRRMIHRSPTYAGVPGFTPPIVKYHGGSSHFFGIGIYPVSDWLGLGVYAKFLPLWFY